MKLTPVDLLGLFFFLSRNPMQVKVSYILQVLVILRQRKEKILKRVEMGEEKRKEGKGT